MRYRYLDDFRRGISVFAIFSHGIAVLGTPQCPPLHIRLHPNSINRDSEIEIPEVWMPTIRQHNSLLALNRLLSRVQRKSVLQPTIRASCS